MLTEKRSVTEHRIIMHAWQVLKWVLLPLLDFNQLCWLVVVPLLRTTPLGNTKFKDHHRVVGLTIRRSPTYSGMCPYSRINRREIQLDVVTSRRSFESIKY